jgi:hypothetical protein
MGTKLVELFTNWVVERRNMIIDYLSGRACIESVRGSVCHFAWLCRFSCLLLAFAVFPLLDDLLELFLPFLVFLLCFMGSWIRISNFVFLFSMDSSRGRLRN